MLISRYDELNNQHNNQHIVSVNLETIQHVSLLCQMIVACETQDYLVVTSIPSMASIVHAAIIFCFVANVFLPCVLSTVIYDTQEELSIVDNDAYANVVLWKYGHIRAKQFLTNAFSALFINNTWTHQWNLTLDTNHANVILRNCKLLCRRPV